MRFDGVETTGRNKPLRVAVVTLDDLKVHDTFLKPSGRKEVGIEGMANEALAGMLARRLGLPACEPFLVEITPQFIESIKAPDVASLLRASSPICFACEDAGSQWAIWTAGESLLSDRVPMALAITAFDAWIENPDRGPSGKPNLLVRGDQFRIIDHEMALRLGMLLSAPEPWKQGYLAMLVQPPSHVLAIKLKRFSGLDFGPIKAAWAALSDRELDAYVAALPPEWASAAPAMARAITHIKEVRDRIDECIAELSRVLR
ncbi:MAG: HipA family kinase [Hyphomonadaceae bacterium]